MNLSKSEFRFRKRSHQGRVIDHLSKFVRPLTIGLRRERDSSEIASSHRDRNEFSNAIEKMVDVCRIREGSEERANKRNRRQNMM
jgi:hypothetical protein